MWRSEPELDNKPWTTYWEKASLAWTCLPYNGPPVDTTVLAGTW